MQRSVALSQSRLLPSFALALLFTLVLFWGMYIMIHATGHGLDKSETLATIDFVRLKKDSELQTLERRKPPPPPPPKTPPPPQKLKVSSNTPTESPTPFPMPNLDLSPGVGGGPMLGELGAAGTGTMGLFDGDIIPLARVSPQYPRQAARDGIEGWVKIEFTVNADGTVRNARVVEAKPRGVFDSAAVTAALKWKFKPRVVDGKPVDQRGVVQIDFNFEGE